MHDNMQRQEIHSRQIDLRFYSRPDGLYEVEGRLIDKKAQPFRRVLGDDAVPPGVPIHDIIVRLVVDDSLVVHEAAASMLATPFQVCGAASRTLDPLVGLTMAKGWNKRVRELLGGAASCTHIMELLGPMATTAFQGLAPRRRALMEGPDAERHIRSKVDSCFAYSAEREVVATLWPHLRRPAA